MSDWSLSVGKFGEAVNALQTRLKQFGFAIPLTESTRAFFGPATRQAVLQFQQAHGLRATGVVDRDTGDLLASERIGPATAGRAGPSLGNSSRGVSGPNVTARALDTEAAHHFPQSQTQSTAGHWTSQAGQDTYIISGSVSSPDRAGAGALTVRLFDKNIGPDVELGSTTTDGFGKYQITVSLPAAGMQQRRKTRPDLQVRVFAGEEFLAASEIRYNASTFETLDVALPAGLTALPSEYETLTASLADVYDGKLADLQEIPERQDITYLANKTGWDANAVALAALADQYSQITVPPRALAPPTAVAPAAVPRPSMMVAKAFAPLPAPAPVPARTAAAVSLRPEFYYALFRAGIPSNEDGVFQTSPQTARAIWEQALEQGVIPWVLADDLGDAVERFATLSAMHTLDANPPVGISTLRQMLQTCLSDPAQQRLFAQIYVENRDNADALWSSVQQSLGETATKRLQLNGQLFYLTLNNAPLVQALHNAEKQYPLASTLDLATRGYHDPAKWMPMIDGSIPAQIPGDNADDQRSHYANLLAAKVRLAFPTAVVADLVRRGTFTLSDASVEPAAVTDFLNAHQGKFAIGIEPVEAYIARTKLTGTPAPVIAQIKRLQRVYQLTPDDQTMAALLQHNLDSAHAITRYNAAGFTRAFQTKLGGAANAAAIHARAKQIHGAVLNIAVSYLNARIAPTLGGTSPVHLPFFPPSPNASSSVIAYPTLESLFGSLDYCNCQECRSILSPAAYLVDLLNFLDSKTPTPGYRDPQEVLFERRPDLQYLALTCENTNTALPYIDIVNEILEYYVANSSLANYRGHDTDGGTSSQELMASPQFVNDAAYVTLQQTFFPAPLPFNRPLELLRLHLRKLGIALPEAMMALRDNDSVDGTHTSPTSFGWRDILMEQLSLSRDEYRLFTDTTLTVQNLYGYPADSPEVSVLVALLSVQSFSRRVGISYDDLFSIVKTRFVNANASLIPRLEKLNASFTILQNLTEENAGATFIGELTPDLDARKYGANLPADLKAVVDWVIANKYSIGHIITVADASNGVNLCDGSVLEFRYSDPAKNQLTATDFVKLIRFIRLWRKLGLSIAQTDDILTALYPAGFLPTGGDDDANRKLLDAGFLILLPRIGFLFQVIDGLGLSLGTDLAPLLACWAPIGTAGDGSLYYKMFLAPAVEEAGPQTATIGGTVYPGDELITTINGVAIPYPVQADYDTDTPTLAADIADAINKTRAPDSDSDLPLSARIYATSDDFGVITLRAGFTLECEAVAGAPGAIASETYTQIEQSLLLYVITVGGTPKAGDQLITKINNFSISYTVLASDTMATIGSNIVDAINETTAPDPFSGLPLNTLVVASIDKANGIIIESVYSGAPLRLTCSLPSPTGTYIAAAATVYWNATVEGPYNSFDDSDVLVTKINGIDISYAVETSHVDNTNVASGIAYLINSNTQPDPVTGQPINSILHASSAGGVVTIAFQSGNQITVECFPATASGNSYTASGPFQIQTATVAGTFVAGTILNTTIDGVAVLHTVVDGDTATTTAANIATAINATTTPDIRQGDQLNKIVSASAQAGVVTIAPLSSGLLVSLVCSVSRGVYVASDAAPESYTATIESTSIKPVGFSILQTYVNGVQISQWSGPSDTVASVVANAIVADINNLTFVEASVEDTSRTGLVTTATIRIKVRDPAQRFTLEVSDSGGNLASPSGFNLGIPEPPPGSSISYTMDGPFQTPPQTATIAGTIAVGSVLTTTIDGIAIAYTVLAGDVTGDGRIADNAVIAGNVAAAINAALTIDPYNNLPLNQTVSASAAGNVITVTPFGRFVYLMECTVIPPSPATYTAGRQRSAFADDGYGDFLSFAPEEKQTLFGHEPTLRAAFNLTGTEFTRIATTLGFTANDPLTLDNISAIFRRGWLAQKLHLSVDEFLRLSEVTGLDPFAPLDPGTVPEPIEPPIIRIMRLLQGMAGLGLEPAQALYLIWNQDITGRAAPTTGEVTGLARSLRADFAAVETQFTLKDDPDGSVTKSLMGLVYDHAATDFFFGLLNGTLTTSTAYSNLPAEADLLQLATNASGDPPRLSYDDLRKQLNFLGFLDPRIQEAIDNAIPNPNDPSPLRDAIGRLAEASQKAISPFFATYPELLPLYAAYATSMEPLPLRRSHVLAQLLPELKQKRKQEQALASITAAVGTDPSFANVLLQDAATLHAATETTAAASTDLTAIEAHGLAAQFFLTNDPSARPDQVLEAVAPGLQTATIGGTITITANDVVTTTINGIAIPYTVSAADATLAVLATHVASQINATTALDPVTKLPINQTISAFANGNVITIVGFNPDAAISSFSVSSGATETYTPGGGTQFATAWSGYLDAPQDGFFDFYITTDTAASVALQIGGVQVPVAPADGSWTNQSAIFLQAGTPTPIVLTATSLTGALSVTWEGRGFGRTAIPAESLYSATLIDNLNATYVRFLKTASLATALSLTASEIADLGTAKRFRVNTTDSLDNLPGGNATFTPASMTNIMAGKTLVISSGAAAQEVVTVAGIAAAPPATIPSKFTATTAMPHDGTATPFPIVSQSLPNIGEGWLNFLSLSAETVNPDSVNASLRDVLTAVIEFARLKRALSPRDERLLAVLQDPTQMLPDGSLAIRSLTGWALDALNALLQRFFGDIDLNHLSSIENFRRVYDAFAIVKACRISPPALIAVATNAPSADSVRGLQAALRAHYAEPDWTALIRPINDTMRIQQRDALVSSILRGFGDIYEESLVRTVTVNDAKAGATTLMLDDAFGVVSGMRVHGANILVYATVTWVSTDGSVGITPGTLASLPAGSSLTFVPPNALEINTADKLFEYFLIDVETQPPVETSRIRLALSSVQLFIERTLRNLEPSCIPRDIEHPDHPKWPWMKRYRVWQANREVFLWPENWLYPELRDDQSPFFQEMMSALLQSDITDDAAACAYLDYLTKLESVAKLEPCGLYYIPESKDPNDPNKNTEETSYVVARTAGAHRKHYFRQGTAAGWTPWTEVKIDCEDMPLAPVVWNGRLFLFWLKVLKQGSPPSVPQVSAPNDSQGALTIDELKGFVVDFAQAGMNAQQRSSITVNAVLCWSEFYNGKWQSTKTSDISRPTTLGNFDIAGPDADRNAWRLVPIFNYLGVPNDTTLFLSIRSTLPINSRGDVIGGGFLLYNTHSLPVRTEDFPRFLLYDGQDRVLKPNLSYSGGSSSITFSIEYDTIQLLGRNQIYANDILRSTSVPRYVEPASNLEPWDAPFFFEDRRSLFYVTTKESLVPVPFYTGFGTPLTPIRQSSVPPPALRQERHLFDQKDRSLVGGDRIRDLRGVER
jgi:peptidoglycan hydrolase-like protein with peptidoglycan-binding domain